MGEKRTEREITRSGNPRRPEGEDGRTMLLRMNESHSPVTAWALGFWKIRESDCLLDIGCGGGAALHAMAAQVKSGHVTGVDYSPEAVELSAAVNAQEIAQGKTEVLPASVEHLPFPDAGFDKILTVESFYFWPDPQENLKEVYRVLKPGGTFLLVADIYRKEGLGEDTLENIRQYRLFNPAPEEFAGLFSGAGFSECVIHTKEGEDWICVEGRR